jgi:hypothetical protein
MYVRVVSDAVSALAPQLRADYRSPFTGAAGADSPIVFGGFVIAFSETGCCIAEEAEDHVKQVIARGQRFLSPGPPALKTKAEVDVAELKARVADLEATRPSSCWEPAARPGTGRPQDHGRGRLGDRHRGQ